MQAQILAHRKAIQQALSVARFHAEQLAALVVADDIDNPSQVPTEDRLPFDIQCLINEVSVGLPVTVDGQAAYEQAQAAFDQLHWLSYSRPDSLTRRGDVLIARRALSNGRSHESAISEWQELVSELFSGQVVIYDAKVDPKNNLRVRFSLVDGASLKSAK